MVEPPAGPALADPRRAGQVNHALAVLLEKPADLPGQVDRRLELGLEVAETLGVRLQPLAGVARRLDRIGLRLAQLLLPAGQGRDTLAVVAVALDEIEEPGPALDANSPISLTEMSAMRSSGTESSA